MSHLMTKPTKWPVHPAKTQISLGIRPVWSVFALRKKKAWVLSYPLSAQWRLGGCPSWSESLQGAQIILLICHEAAHILLMILNFKTYKSGQKVCRPRSDCSRKVYFASLCQCLTFILHFRDALLYGKTTVFKFYDYYSIFFSDPNFSDFTIH